MKVFIRLSVYDLSSNEQKLGPLRIENVSPFLEKKETICLFFILNTECSWLFFFLGKTRASFFGTKNNK